MGKVLVSGHAEREFVPDYCSIELKVETKGENTAKTAKAALIEFERLIAGLVEMGIKYDEMTISEDRSTTPWRNEPDYESSREVEVTIPVNVAAVNSIHNLIASGFENTEISVHYRLKSYDGYLCELKKQAIQNSRKKAELLAEATGTKVIGIDAVNLDGHRDLNFDIAELDMAVTESKEETDALCMRASEDYIETPYSDQLSPGTITLRSDVCIVWLIE